LHFGGEKPQILPVLGFRHFDMSLIGGVRKKFKAGAQLQTFPYSTFLYSNNFMEVK